MRKSTLTRRGLLQVGGAAVGLGFVPMRYARAQGTPIRIGCIQTLSGSLADIGQAHIYGAEMARDYINENGGVNGQPVELVIRDTKLSATDAVTTLREFAGDGINLVIGEAFTSVNLAALPLLEQLDMCMVSPTTVAMELTHELYSRNFFRCGPNAYMQYNGETNLISQDHPDVTRWGGLHADNSGFKVGWDMMSETLKRNYREKNDVEIEIVDPIIVKPGATDYRTVINQLLGKRLEGLIMVLGGGEAVSFYRQAKPFRLDKSVQVVADNNLNVTAGPTLKKDLPDNFYTSCMWRVEPYSDIPLGQDFGNRWLARFDTGEVNPYASNSHSALMTLVAGIQNAGSTATTDVVEAIEKTEIETVYGPLSYRTEDHQLMVDPGYMELSPSDEEPGWVLDKFARVPAAEAMEPASPGTPFIL